MAKRQVIVDGVQFVPVTLLATLCTPSDRKVARLVAAAIDAVRADEEIDEGGGLERYDRSFAALKRAVRALEMSAGDATVLGPKPIESN